MCYAPRVLNSGRTYYSFKMKLLAAHLLIGAAFVVGWTAASYLAFSDGDPTHLCSDNIIVGEMAELCDKPLVIQRASFDYAARNALIRAEYAASPSSYTRRKLADKWHVSPRMIGMITAGLIENEDSRSLLPHTTIRESYDPYNHRPSLKALAARYHVSTGTIGLIVNDLRLSHEAACTADILRRYEPLRPRTSIATLARDWNLDRRTVQKMVKGVHDAYVAAHPDEVAEARKRAFDQQMHHEKERLALRNTRRELATVSVRRYA
jgi:hypothetical protein